MQPINFLNLHRFSRVVVCLLFAATISGCSSQTKPGAVRDASSAASDSHAEIDMNCLGNRISNPQDSFHYSFKATDEQNAVDKEADVTSQTIEATIADKSGSHSYHGVRTDEASWGRAVLDLSGSGMTVMIARIGFIKDRNTSSLKLLDTGNVNGYSASHFAIDTDAASARDKQSFSTLFGAGSYDKGEIWAAADGCPVKLFLDEAKQQTNGTIGKTHFEVNFVKK